MSNETGVGSPTGKTGCTGAAGTTVPILSSSSQNDSAYQPNPVEVNVGGTVTRTNVDLTNNTRSKIQ
jgi:plastocyanin